MQRWIVIGVVLLFLLVVGGGAGAWVYKQNKADMSYMPHPVPKEATDSDKQKMLKAYKDFMLKDEIVKNVAREAAVKEYFKLASDADAEAEVRNRAFTELGTNTDSHNIKFESLRMGFKGKKKEMPELQAMTEALGRKFKEEARKEKDSGY